MRTVVATVALGAMLATGCAKGAGHGPAVPESAQTAKGEFNYTTVGDRPQGIRNRSLKAPENGRCHILNIDPSDNRVTRVQNKTDVPATVFANNNCTGQSGVIAVGATQNSCADGTPCWESVRFPPPA
jgi:hypothetical protein